MWIYLTLINFACKHDNASYHQILSYGTLVVFIIIPNVKLVTLWLQQLV